MKPREEFIGLLDNSRDVVEQVNDFFANRGYCVSVIPSTTTPDAESRWEHTDGGDIEIRQRIEVKHWPEIDFRSIDSIPYTDVIVDEAYKIDAKKERTLLSYVLVNASRTGCVIIPVWTRKFWKLKTLTDGREGRTSEYYTIHKKQLTYYSLEVLDG